MSTTNSKHLIFNKFQSDFYTSITEFNKYTYFEIKQNTYLLLNNLIKGYPHLANEIMDIYSPDVKALESPQIIFALQRKFVNGFSRTRIPQHVYFKSGKVPTTKTVKDKKSSKIFIEFESDIVSELKTILQIDTKTYQYLKFTDKIQKLGKHILDEKKKIDEEFLSKFMNKNIQ